MRCQPALFIVLCAGLAAQDAEPNRERGQATPATDELVFRRIGPYEPMYFVVGTRGEGLDAHFQFSAKYQVWQGLHGAFTQTSLWDLSSDSAPFIDSSYKPRVFWYEPAGPEGAWYDRTGWEIGLGHESNGQPDAKSRSMNLAFVQPEWTLGQVWGRPLLVAPRMIAYLEDSENPDIADYRGYGDYRAVWGGTQDWQLSALVRKGMDLEPYYVQLDLSVPCGPYLGGGVDPLVHLQVDQGWGETLIEYREYTGTAVRIGVMLVR